MRKLRNGVEEEEDAREIDARGCAVRGSDMCAMLEVAGRGAWLEVCGPGKGVE